MHSINRFYQRIITSSVFMLQAAVVSVLIGFTSTATADSVFVSLKHHKIFIADRGLIVKDLNTGLVNNFCGPNGVWYDPAGHDVTALLDTATDVVVRHHYAVVTIHPLDGEGNPFVDTVTVDLTDCLAIRVVDIDECIATVDLDDGFMTIPCVAYNGGYLTVKMNRRGRSNNWEVHTFGDNVHLNNYHGYRYDRDDDYDDYDDDDDDDDD